MRRAALDMVYELARQDPRVVFVGSDLGAGTLERFRQEMPERFFMEGVSEQNIIGMAAGLAMEGFIPYVNTIATFLTRRCYEQVAVDLCLHRLPVRLIANGGGLVYAPLGPTHLAIEDIAIMRALPEMTVVAPCDADEMRRLMPGTLNLEGPCYIRLAKGGDPVVSEDDGGFEIGRAILMRDPGDVLFISTGIGTTRALDAVKALGRKSGGDKKIDCGVLHLHTVKPLDADAILKLAPRVQMIATVEEHTLVGGLGSSVGDLLMDVMPRSAPRLVRFGIPDRFPDRYGTQDELLAHFGLQGEQIAERLRSLLRGRQERAA